MLTKIDKILFNITSTDQMHPNMDSVDPKSCQLIDPYSPPKSGVNMFHIKKVPYGPLTTRSHLLTPLRHFEYRSGQPARAAGDAVQEKGKVILQDRICVIQYAHSDECA